MRVRGLFLREAAERNLGAGAAKPTRNWRKRLVVFKVNCVDSLEGNDVVLWNAIANASKELGEALDENSPENRGFLIP
jgi:hypothetical protein